METTEFTDVTCSGHQRDREEQSGMAEVDDMAGLPLYGG